MERAARTAATLLALALAGVLVSAANGDNGPSTWKQRAREQLRVYNYSNTRPLIGILSQPCTNCPGKSYIPAAYVKWVEAGGARAVPIRYHESDEMLLELFKSVNGLVFPGGLTWLWLDAPYVVTARKLYNWAIEANDAGDFFPIHGTCLGHQLLHILLTNADRDTVLIETDSVQNANILNFTKAAADSMYFADMDPALLEKVASPKYNIAYENHEMGVPPAHYEQWPELKEWYNILSTTRDRNGVEYISTVEGKMYPFFGTQWHPEKPPFEFSDRHIPHMKPAIHVSQHLADTFVDIARLSQHKVDPEVELDITIYNYAPTYTAKDDVFEGSYDGPDMCYFLPEGAGPDVHTVQSS